MKTTTDTIQIRDPQINDWLQPDGWGKSGSTLLAGDAPCDASYRGCQFRVIGPATGRSYPVNLTITGRREHYLRGTESTRVRVRIEWVGDGEPNEYGSGWIYLLPKGA